MMEFIFPLLKQKKCSKIILHVLEQNVPAINCYSKIGFKFSRKELCFRLNMADFRENRSRNNNISIKESEIKFVENFEHFWEWEPMWDDLIFSVKRISDVVEVLVAFVENTCVGYIIFYPNFMQIMQLCVHKDFRRQGIATTLIRAVFDKYPKLPGVNYMGVPEQSSTVKFLEYLGFQVFLTQLEMSMEL